MLAEDWKHPDIIINTQSSISFLWETDKFMHICHEDKVYHDENRKVQKSAGKFLKRNG